MKKKKAIGIASSMLLCLALLAVLLITTVPEPLEPVSSDCYAAQLEGSNENADEEGQDIFLDSTVPEEYQRIAYDVSLEYGIDFPLLVALIEVESGGDPEAISGTNDYGLCQINESNHKWLRSKLDTKDFLDPRENIEACCYMLRRYFRVYDNTYKVLLAYHYGGHIANKLISQGITCDAYAREILKRESEMVEEFIND